jgi:type IV fimbrial biogenesis protein FimT
VIELMITVAIIAILMMVSAPSLRDVIRNARMTSLANDLMTDLSLARGEAVKRGVRISMCTSNTGTACTNTEWRHGWIIFAEADTTGTQGKVDTNDVILKVSPKINGADETPPTLVTSANNLVETGSYVNFRPSGVTTPGGALTPAIHFYVCDARKTGLVSASEALNKGRHITVLGTGRAQASRCTCDNTGALCTP